MVDPRPGCGATSSTVGTCTTVSAPGRRSRPACQGSYGLIALVGEVGKSAASGTRSLARRGSTSCECELGVVPDDERRGTIFYPFHSWDKQAVIGDHRELADEIAATEDGPITVCLYWIEFRDAKIRRFYADRGFRVISHGYRGDRTKRGSVQFLRRQLTELRKHRRWRRTDCRPPCFTARRRDGRRYLRRPNVHRE